MPSMTTTHGGILYYVVKVAKDEPNEPWTPGQRSFEEKIAIASSTPIFGQPIDTSTDSGWDNPFRPDGDLSREADEIVELIKGGKPITPTPVNGDAPKLPESNGTENGKVPSPAKGAVTTVSSSPPPTTKSANGTKPLSNGDKSGGPTGGPVELQRATIAPSEAAQVEHVNLKKKPKCKCCVVQ